MTFYASYPAIGSGGGVPTYTNLAAFPSAVGAGNGALAIALDTDILYISNGTVWEALADPTISPLAITALTGDGTATGPGSVPLTLATVNSNVGTFGTASSVSTVTVNAKGLTTAAASVAIQIAESQVTNLVSDLAGKVPTTRLINTTAPITGGGDLSADRTIAMPAATTSVNGYLTSTDWNTFNNKQPAGSYVTSLSGDVTGTGPGATATTLATVNSNIGSFGTASSVSTVTVNAKGLTTAASNTAIQIAESQVTNLVSDLAGKQPTGNYITALTGDVTATGPGSVAATIANLAVTNAKIANATIDLATKVTGALPLINGGIGVAAASANAAFNALSPLTTKGDILGFSTVNARLPVGSNGQVLSADSGQTLGLAWANAATYSRSDVATAGAINTLSSSTSFVRLTGSTTTTVNGIAAGTAGQLLEVYNVSTANVTFTNQSGSAGGATERIIIPTGVSYLLKPGYSTWFIYDDSQSRWICQATDIPVAARYHYSAAGQTITNGTATTLKMTVQDYDTHSAYDTSTGIFTVPVNGYYICSALIQFVAFAVADTSPFVGLWKNGTQQSESKILTSATNNTWCATGTDHVFAAVGDTLELKGFQNSGSNRTAGFNETINFVAFKRV